MSFSPDLSSAIRTSLLGVAAIANNLAAYKNSRSIHTRMPTPDDAKYPMIVISADISHMDIDALTDFRSIITKDILIYGEQPDDYRVIEGIARETRRLFHRNRRSISQAGIHVVSVTALGPLVAPEQMASNQPSIVGRVVPVTFIVQPKP